MKHEQNALNAIRNHGGAVTEISGNFVMFAIGGKNFRIGEGDGPSCSEFSETIHRLVKFAASRPSQGAAIKAARDAYRCNVADAALWLWMNRMNQSTWKGFQANGELIIKMHAACVDTARRAKEFREGYPELHDFDGAEYVRASDYDERLHASDVYFDSWKNTEAQFNQQKLELHAACGETTHERNLRIEAQDFADKLLVVVRDAVRALETVADNSQCKDSAGICRHWVEQLKPLTGTHRIPDVNPVSELLSKYIKHVQDCEGVDFISRIHDTGAAVTFTDDEVRMLERFQRGAV